MVNKNLQKQSPFAGIQRSQVSTGEPDGARQDETFTPTTQVGGKELPRCYINCVRARTWYELLPQEVMNIKKLI